MNNLINKQGKNSAKALVHKLMNKVTLTFMALLISFSAWAITLEQAKQQGFVGEMANGYLGVVVSSKEVEALVASVNTKRKTIYLDLARKNKLSMKQVTVLAGEKAFSKTAKGHYIQDSSGKWMKK